jgi:hypothetical protein
VSVTEITLVRGAYVNIIFIDGVLDFVGENTCGEAGDELFRLVHVRRVEHVVVDEHIFPQES